MPLTPVEIGAKLQAASRKLSAGDARGAHALLAELVKAAPQVAEAHFMLGVIAAGRGEHKAALAAFGNTLKLKPGFVQAVAQSARSLDALGRREEALKAAEQAAGAQDAYSLDTVGVVLTRAGLHERALEVYARAARAGNGAGYWYNYAAALQFVGKFEEARAAYRECLKRDADHGPAWAGLVQITRQTREANEIAQLTHIAERHANDVQATRVLGHALAKAHEDLGEYSEAMAWLQRAKARLRGKHDARADEALFAAAERSVEAPEGNGFPGAAPIFVVGMPRTGTTLVDRILTGHSEVESAGELNDFPDALRRATGAEAKGLISPELIERAASADMEAVGRGYMAAVKSAMGFSGRFVDKLPLNAFLAPLILRALPDARVICLRRHPADTVLSNYRQDFGVSADMLDYAFDLEAAAKYHVGWGRMMNQFAGALPKNRFIEVAYEDLVADLEGQVRRLLDFCGLGFEEACLHFEENAAPVATASAAQARQPIYASSIGRWRKYRPAIDPALQVLVDGGVMRAEELI
jgi:tetratricopeptide (TPR) repeat protein